MSTDAAATETRNPAHVARFLDTLYGHVIPRQKDDLPPNAIPPYGIEIRAFRKSESPIQSWWVYLNGTESAICQLSGTYDTYVGAGLRSKATGSKDAVGLLTALWGEIDCEKQGMPIQEGVQLLQQLSMPPSMIVMSGHGVHGWWLLDVPLVIDPSSKERAETIMRGIADTIQGDRTVAEIARIMRVPGTLNIKSEPAIMAELIDCYADWRYSLDALEFRYVPRVRETIERSQTIKDTSHVSGVSLASWQEFKDTIRDRCDLVELINSYHIPNPLEQRGSIWRGSMHSNDGISLVVFADKKRGFCHNDRSPWGRRSFDCFAWVQEMERCTFLDACKLLGNRYGVQPPQPAEPYMPDINNLIKQVYKQYGNSYSSTNGNGTYSTTEAAVSNKHNLTDLGNARRFVDQHGYDTRYCHTWGMWFIWDGARWKEDTTDQVQRLARLTVGSIYEEAATTIETDTRHKIGKWALTSESKNRLDAMVATAQAEPGIPVEHTAFDADPWFLNTQNGTLDLRTGLLMQHERVNYCRKIVPIEYDPAATCPTWERFLKRVMDNNIELTEFIQRAVGYSLTGLTIEQCLFFLYGTGKNGKSTFIETLGSLFGDYFTKIPTESLMSKREGGDPANGGIAQLPGARFVVASETEDGKRINESLIKDLTGGDTISARILYRMPFTFKPVFKLWMYGNHKPQIRGTDEGIWRRIRLIPFTVTIPEHERDSDMPAKLRAELPGILNWAVIGCLAWQRDGLKESDTVRRATNAYRSEMDVLAAFLDEVCIVSARAKVASRALYSAYLQWCEETGERPYTQRRFMSTLKERGYIAERGTDNQYFWYGIGLQT